MSSAPLYPATRLAGDITYAIWDSTAGAQSLPAASDVPHEWKLQLLAYMLTFTPGAQEVSRLIQNYDFKIAAVALLRKIKLLLLEY